MELTLTKEQKRHLDKHGPMNAATLQRIFRRSVQDQQKLLRQAARIRAQQQRATK